MSQQMTDAADELINAIREWRSFTLFRVRRSSRNLCRAIDHWEKCYASELKVKARSPLSES